MAVRKRKHLRVQDGTGEVGGGGLGELQELGWGDVPRMGISPVGPEPLPRTCCVLQPVALL